jgi:hypothetical protein
MAMKFISEENIEKIIEQYYDSEKKYFSDRDALMANQPSFAALLTDEGFELLTDDEYELLCFMATVIHTSVVENHGTINPISQSQMEEIDENNWTVMEDTTTSNFKERLNPFFKDNPQEDLLAFVEDSLESDEDITVTPAGRELIFVACKTLIDSLQVMSAEA